MRIRRGMTAAGITIAVLGVPFVTAEAASAHPLPPPPPATVSGVITGPHTFTLDVGETVYIGELLRPETPQYGSYVPVTGIATVHGVTTVTTGSTFLPLNRAHETTTFAVVQQP